MATNKMTVDELAKYIKDFYSQDEINQVISKLPVEEIIIKEYDHSCDSDTSHVFYDLNTAKAEFAELVQKYEESGDSCYIVAEGQGWYDEFEQ